MNIYITVVFLNSGGALKFANICNRKVIVQSNTVSGLENVAFSFAPHGYERAVPNCSWKSFAQKHVVYVRGSRRTSEIIYLLPFQVIHYTIVQFI